MKRFWFWTFRIITSSSLCKNKQILLTDFAVFGNRSGVDFQNIHSTLFVWKVDIYKRKLLWFNFSSFFKKKTLEETGTSLRYRATPRFDFLHSFIVSAQSYAFQVHGKTGEDSWYMGRLLPFGFVYGRELVSELRGLHKDHKRSIVL